MSLGTANRDGGKTSESGHLRALYKAFGSGVISGLNVSQRGAGANMSVDIAIGDSIIGRSDLTYGHPSFNDAVLNQAVTTADPSNPRRDILVMYIDYGQTPSTGVSNNTNGVVKVKVVAGTPAGSPVDPSDSAIQSSVGAGNAWIKLARIRVGAGVTSIGNSVIDDLRTMITPAIKADTDTARQLTVFDHVASGCVISGDSYGSTRAFSMTAGTVVINGKVLSVAAISGHLVTASRDCYLDLVDNLDGTAVPVYTEVTNNNASPALAANSIRVGIVITGASSIANTGSINQGETTKVLPIASSNAYSVTDSLGNLICPRDPSRKLIGFRQIYAQVTGLGGAGEVAVTGLNLVTAIVPANRKIKLYTYLPITSSSGGLQKGHLRESTTKIQTHQLNMPTVGAIPITPERVIEVSAGLHTFNAAVNLSGTAGVYSDGTDWWAFVKVELE